MPIITVQFIKDVVATPEQKRELIVRLTDTFVDVLGDVVRPFVYCLIQETPQNEWGIAGVPMPDLVYLTGEKHAGVIGKSNDIMRSAIAQMAAAAAGDSGASASQQSNGGSSGSGSATSANQQADDVWRHADSAPAAQSQSGSAADRNKNADDVWRGASSGSSNGRGSSSRDPAEEHRALFKRWFEELWNKKNYAIAHELVHPDFTAHGAGGQDIKQGPDGVIGMVKAWHAAMPDGRMTMDDIVTEGDLSTIRMTWEATHTGQFGNIPASGNRIKVTSIGIDRVVNGKITEGWGELDMLGMLQQMGAIPTPPPAGGSSDASGQQQSSQASSASSGNGSANGNTNGSSNVNKASTSNLTNDTRKVRIYRMYDEANKGNVDILDEMLAENFVSYGGAGFQDLHGREAFKELYRTFFRAFPDLKFHVEQVVIGGDMAAVRGIQTGTHKGDFLGLVPATGKQVSWSGTAIFRFDENNRIVERWQDLDNLSLFQQLGVVPAFSSAGG